MRSVPTPSLSSSHCATTLPDRVSSAIQAPEPSLADVSNCSRSVTMPLPKSVASSTETSKRQSFHSKDCSFMRAPRNAGCARPANPLSMASSMGMSIAARNRSSHDGTFGKRSASWNARSNNAAGGGSAASAILAANASRTSASVAAICRASGSAAILRRASARCVSPV